MTLDANKLLVSPDVFPQRLEAADLIFVSMSRDTYQRSIFTDVNRAVTAGSEAWAVPLGELLALVDRHRKPLPAPAFIFHIAHCGSTLLSRAIDRPGSSLVIREPMVLRQLAADPHLQRTDIPLDQAAQRCLDALIYLLSRQYQADERVVVKANVPVNFMLPALNQQLANPAGVLLYCSPDAYLVAALKSPERRAWAKHVCQEMATGIHSIEHLAGIDIAALSAAQSAALLWLAQMVKFQAALDANERLRALDCEAFYDSPADVIRRCCEHFDIDMPATEADAISNSELFSRYAKDPNLQYDNAERKEQHQRLRERFTDEIEAAMNWCGDIWPCEIPTVLAQTL